MLKRSGHTAAYICLSCTYSSLTFTAAEVKRKWSMLTVYKKTPGLIYWSPYELYSIKSFSCFYLIYTQIDIHANFLNSKRQLNILRLFQNGVLRKIFKPKREEGTRGWTKTV